MADKDKKKDRDLKKEVNMEKEKISSLPDGNMCKISKKDYLDKFFEEFKALVKEPEYICKKCGRVAKDKGRLCAGKEL